MHLELTVVDPLGVRAPAEVEITAAARTSLREVRAGLLAAVGRDDGLLLVDGRVLDDDCPLGAPRLLDGTVLTVDRPGPREPRGLLELHVLAGPDSGDVHRLCPVSTASAGRSRPPCGSTIGRQGRRRSVHGEVRAYSPPRMLRLGGHDKHAARVDINAVQEPQPVAAQRGVLRESVVQVQSAVARDHGERRGKRLSRPHLELGECLVTAPSTIDIEDDEPGTGQGDAEVVLRVLPQHSEDVRLGLLADRLPRDGWVLGRAAAGPRSAARAVAVHRVVDREHR